MKIQYIFLLIFNISLNVWAGGWTSGGGENIRDSHNPWFLENTTTVKYCIEIDETSISSSLITIKQMVKKSIDDWSHIFSDYQVVYPKSKVKIASQNWILVNCNQDPDLKFKFGWNSLNEEEKNYLSNNGNSLEYVAVAVRTSYDEVNLKGQGFIFLASDIGPNAFSLEPGQISKPWQYPTLIYLELIHELGHVFGLPHISSELFTFSPRWVMSERFPEMVLNSFIWNDKKLKLQDPKTGIEFFFEPNIYQTCNLTYEFRKWLEVSDQVKCLEFNSLNFESTYIYLTGLNDTGLVISQFKPIQITNFESTFIPDISVYLTEKQKVFVPPISGEFSILGGPGSKVGEFFGKIDLKSGNSKSIMFLKKEDSIQIVGIDSSSNTLRKLLSLYHKNYLFN